MDQRHAGQRQSERQKEHNYPCHTQESWRNRCRCQGHDAGSRADPSGQSSRARHPGPCFSLTGQGNAEDEQVFTFGVRQRALEFRPMDPRAHRASPTHRIVAIFMVLAVLVAGQAVHVPIVHADADVDAPHAMMGHSPDEYARDVDDANPPGDGLQSKQACAGTECGGCVASIISSPLGSPALHDLPSDHAVISSAVRPPERLFRPPILPS